VLDETGGLALLLVALAGVVSLVFKRDKSRDQVEPTKREREAARAQLEAEAATRRAHAQRESDRERAELAERRRLDSLDDRIDVLLPDPEPGPDDTTTDAGGR
jgi:C4-dicarboxylate-specific signal transduction histidine kinase